jgi:hypothetical protein
VLQAELQARIMIISRPLLTSRYTNAHSSIVYSLIEVVHLDYTEPSTLTNDILEHGRGRSWILCWLLVPVLLEALNLD